MKLKNNRFSGNERLKTSSDFRKVKQRKHQYFNQGPVKVYILKQNLEYSRLGVITYKKAGKAVFRNKIRRWLREIFRVNKSDFQENLDILFAVGQAETVPDFKFLKDSFFNALSKCRESKQPEKRGKQI